LGLHCFVAMPFGTKEGIDFNRVYEDLIKPALEGAGFEVFRADKETRAGEIRKDMFQELLLADLVVADLSIDNPNVWYELGVRHALRARGVIQIFTRRERVPFDVSTDRALNYRVTEATAAAPAVPDPKFVEEDKKRLAIFATDTIKSWHGAKASPVYDLIPALQEQGWKELKVKETDTLEFWDRYKQWIGRVETARRQSRAGDVMVLSGETPTWVMRLEAKRMSGKALTKLQRYRLALEAYDEALAIDPKDLESQRQRGMLLGRIGRREEARTWVQQLQEAHPGDVETSALMGRIQKEDWITRWRKKDRTPAQMREQAARDEALLHEAIKPYFHAFVLDSSHFYPGINALTLCHLHRHIGGRLTLEIDLAQLEGGVLWSCLSALEANDKNYWARITLAEIKLLSLGKDEALKFYRYAFATADNDWFALDSTRQQLMILRDLEFRGEAVGAVLAEVETEIANLGGPLTPRKVLLFSGHMIDAPDRPSPRFPPEQADAARALIEAQLKELDGGEQDLGICSGACGGDLLFAEGCLARGMRVQLYIPFEEPEFLQQSVAFPKDGQKWRERFAAVKANEKTTLLVMPDELGELPKGVNAYERVNTWQLFTALAFGAERLHFVCLWNGEGGDGPGGTKHMLEEVKRNGGHVYVIDAKALAGA
jgi:tetratricopeptide (TPR) repeat protein